jgi:predicted acetylornithine/succinylornithine family transaminase
MNSALLGIYRPLGEPIVAGRGCRLIAEDGREFLDFVSGIAVNALGYGDPGIADAIGQVVAGGVLHTSNLYRTHPAELLAEDLVRHSFADRVFFCNSGAEANEAAFKFARRWAREAGGAAKHEIVALRGSFHGRLFGTLAATDRPAYQHPFEPLTPGFRFVVPGDRAGLLAAVSPERTAALIAEPVQGEGGVRVLSAAELGLLREVADQVGAALILDEVQCGLGRTGKFFAHDETGITPDLLTLAKPLAGGLPMGAVLLTERIAGSLRPGDHGTTFGGGPLVSAVARVVVERLSDPALLEGVRRKGVRVREVLGPLVGRHGVRDLRGCGLIWGVELEGPAAPVVQLAFDAGLLVTTAGERVLRLLPPLVIDDAELDMGLERLREILLRWN